MWGAINGILKLLPCLNLLQFNCITNCRQIILLKGSVLGLCLLSESSLIAIRQREILIEELSIPRPHLGLILLVAHPAVNLVDLDVSHLLCVVRPHTLLNQPDSLLRKSVREPRLDSGVMHLATVADLHQLGIRPNLLDLSSGIHLQPTRKVVAELAGVILTVEDLRLSLSEMFVSNLKVRLWVCMSRQLYL